MMKSTVLGSLMLLSIAACVNAPAADPTPPDMPAFEQDLASGDIAISLYHNHAYSPLYVHLQQASTSAWTDDASTCLGLQRSTAATVNDVAITDMDFGTVR